MNLVNPNKVAGKSFPRFVVVEGIDGSGKTTVIKNVIKPYVDEWLRVNRPEFDSSCVALTPWENKAKAIREVFLSTKFDDPIVEMLLAFAARRHVYTDHIIPSIEHINQNLVVIDRWFASTFAYQAIDEKEVRLWADLSYNVCDLTYPGLTIYLDVDVEVAVERIAKARGATPDVFESRKKDFFSECKERYSTMIGLHKAITNTKVAIINANNIEEQVKIDIEKCLNQHLISTYII